MLSRLTVSFLSKSGRTGRVETKINNKIMAGPMSAPVPPKKVIDSKDLKPLYITVFPKSLTEDFYQFGACSDLLATSIFIISQYKTNRTAYLRRKKQCPKMMKES